MREAIFQYVISMARAVCYRKVCCNNQLLGGNLAKNSGHPISVEDYGLPEHQQKFTLSEPLRRDTLERQFFGGIVAKTVTHPVSGNHEEVDNDDQGCKIWIESELNVVVYTLSQTTTTDQS
jgi:hypothetical protein